MVLKYNNIILDTNIIIRKRCKWYLYARISDHQSSKCLGNRIVKINKSAFLYRNLMAFFWYSLIVNFKLLLHVKIIILHLHFMTVYYKKTAHEQNASHFYDTVILLKTSGCLRKATGEIKIVEKNSTRLHAWRPRLLRGASLYLICNI